MTLIILTVLGTAWLGYFALWYREKRASRPLPGGGMVGFNGSAHFNGSGSPRGFASLNGSASGVSRGIVAVGDAAEGGIALGDLLDTPRTRYQARRRRRQVAVVLGAVAVVSLLAAPALGSAALTVHVMADLGLLLFAMSAVHRQQAAPVAALRLADVRVLYPDRPPADPVAMPLERAATG